jgi:hypothetical protein
MLHYNQALLAMKAGIEEVTSIHPTGDKLLRMP